MSHSGVAANEIDVLRPRLRQWGEAFAGAAAIADWARIKELDSQLQKVLLQLNARPDVKAALDSELSALRRQHSLALAACRQELEILEHRLQAFAREREGLQAYSEVSGAID